MRGRHVDLHAGAGPSLNASFTISDHCNLAAAAITVILPQSSRRIFPVFIVGVLALAVAGIFVAAKVFQGAVDETDHGLDSSLW